MSESLSLEARVATAFYGQFGQLRPAQQAAIEPLLSGRNVVLTSATGSGKTEAIIAPLVSKYWRQAASSDNLFLLYISPTKALVNDLERRLQLPLSTLGLRVGVRHGDRDDLHRGPVPHVLITTPESLEVLLFRKEPAIATVRAVVIDEVHLLYNTQRGLQLSILLRRLRQRLPSGFQWAALSATVGDLSLVLEFLVGPGDDAVLLSFPSERPIDAHIRHIRTEADFLALVQRMTQGRSTKLLIFVNSRRDCERLTGVLQTDPAIGHFVFAHYSSLSPEVRVETERKFASMSTAICAATSTLELGIDIGDIDAVLLWGAPSGVTSFLQRIGRGNRRSNKSNVVCLVPDDSPAPVAEALKFAALLDAATKSELPVQEPYELFGAVGQQCLSAIACEGGRFTRIADLCALVAHKPYLTRDVVEAVLAELASNGFLQRHGYKNQYGADEELHSLVDLKLIYGNFPIGSQTVDLFHGAKRLGEIPAVNLLRVRGNPCVRFAGKCWRVARVSHDGIHLEPSRPTGTVVQLLYYGGAPPSDPDVLDRTWRLIHSQSLPLQVFAQDLRQRVGAFASKLRSNCSETEIPYLRTEGGILYWTFGGRMVNRAVALVARKLDFTAGDITLLVSSPIDWPAIPRNPLDYEEFFDLLFEASSEQSFYQQQLPIELQRRECLQGWLKDAAIPRILSRLSRAAAVQMESLQEA